MLSEAFDSNSLIFPASVNKAYFPALTEKVKLFTFLDAKTPMLMNSA
jgi:hypothetical protein